MIKDKKTLRFYIMADMMMNRGKFKWGFKDRLKHIFCPDYVMSYLKAMRWCQYYSNGHSTIFHQLILKAFWYLRYKRLGLKLGFTIGCQTLGYGVVIPHYGTIVIGGTNRIGNYAVLHTSTCISDNGKKIGEAMYLATGAKLTSKLELGDNVSIGANSLVNKSFPSNVLIAGMPAVIKKEAEAWYVKDGVNYTSRVNAVEALKKQINIID